MALIVGSNGPFHIGPKLIKITNFCPEFDTIQRYTGRNRLHRQICVAVAVHYYGVCFVLAGDVPLDRVCVLDRGQADEIRQFGVKFVQHLNNPIKIEIMEIGVGRFVNRIDDTHFIASP